MKRRNFLLGLIATPLAAALAKVPLPQGPQPITWWQPCTAYEKGDIVVWTDGTLKQCFMGGISGTVWDVNSTLRGPRWKDLPPHFPWNVKFKTARARASFRRIKPEDSVL